MFQTTSSADFNLWTILSDIDWREPFVIGIVIFHIAVTLTALLTRNHGNFQLVLFLALLLLVYFSENINELAAEKWSRISRHQYFDRKGMFISLIFSVPILLNIMVLMASWLWQSSELMVQLKRAQLKQNRAISKNGSSKHSDEEVDKSKTD
ncbi:unnamed protein product [Nezara viridula]|uniref:Transmembrane protein 18 n=1 Tax=Nezara viridula TaxID=85310 RepID=A0A9P0H7G9_NEZVI|nr:unnamed protein product [Nezara viridula]